MKLLLALGVLLAFAVACALGASRCTSVPASKLAAPADRERFQGHACLVCGTAPACDGRCGWLYTKVDECGHRENGNNVLKECPDGSSTCQLLGKKAVCCISKANWRLSIGGVTSMDWWFDSMVRG